MTGVIDVSVRLYLEVDVDKEEAHKIIQEMDFSFKHKLISNTDLYHYETE